VRIELEQAKGGARERDPGRVVGVVGIREQHGVPAFRHAENDLDERRLRPRHDAHLVVRIELDAVVRRVPRGDRLAQLGQTREGCIAVYA
jgi:hypothetical protein